MKFNLLILVSCFCLVSCTNTKLDKQYLCNSTTAVKIDAITGKIWPYEMPTRYVFKLSGDKIIHKDNYNLLLKNEPLQILKINNIEKYSKEDTVYIQARNQDKEYRCGNYNDAFIITGDSFTYTYITKVYTMVITGICVIG
jgi:hypothetical protein